MAVAEEDRVTAKRIEDKDRLEFLLVLERISRLEAQTQLLTDQLGRVADEKRQVLERKQVLAQALMEKYGLSPTDSFHPETGEILAGQRATETSPDDDESPAP
jgi:PHP family Zn ribbon phosphoesterase